MGLGALALALALGACKKAPVPAPDAATTAVGATGPVLLGVEGDVRWTAGAQAGPARAGALPPDTVVETGADGRATVRLVDGRELTLEPGTRLKVGPPAAPGAPATVEVLAGGVVSRAGALELEILTPFGLTRIPADGAAASIQVEIGRVSVQVSMGQITFVDRTGQTFSAGPGDRIEVSMGGVQILRGRREPAAAPVANEERPRPGRERPPAEEAPERAAARIGRALDGPGEITLPPQRGLRVFADRLRRVTLTWPARGEPAEVEVASDPGFKRLLFAGPAEGGRLTVGAPRAGTLHWRVRGADGAVAASGSARFYPESRRSLLDLANPHNLVADTGEKATVYFQSVPPALTFSFAADKRARAYRVRVYAAGKLDRALVEREVREPRCALPGGAIGEGSYLWHAAPLDAAGRELSGGRMNKLEVVYDNSLSTLAIASPKPGQPVAGDRVEVSGVAPLGSKLYVNGQPAPLDDKGRFEMRVDRAEALVFRLVGRGGAESYWVRSLRRGS
jgi:hypothetical protein